MVNSSPIIACQVDFFLEMWGSSNIRENYFLFGSVYSVMNQRVKL